MFSTLFPTLVGVLATTLLALVGILFFAIDDRVVRKYLLYAVSLSTGALLGDVFIHILPEMTEAGGEEMGRLFTTVLAGIVFCFCIEKFIHWHHCHVLPNGTDCGAEGHHHHHHVGIMSLVGEGVHNFMDGVIIAAAFLASIPVGISTTIAVALHELPHEIGNYAVMRHSGFSKWGAVLSNLCVSASSFIGAAGVLVIGSSFAELEAFFLPFAAGNLLYIAGSDFIPELHKESRLGQSVGQVACMLVGIGLMHALTLLE